MLFENKIDDFDQFYFSHNQSKKKRLKIIKTRKGWGTSKKGFRKENLFEKHECFT